MFRLLNVPRTARIGTNTAAARLSLCRCRPQSTHSHRPSINQPFIQFPRITVSHTQPCSIRAISARERKQRKGKGMAVVVECSIRFPFRFHHPRPHIHRPAR